MKNCQTKAEVSPRIPPPADRFNAGCRVISYSVLSKVFSCLAASLPGLPSPGIPEIVPPPLQVKMKTAHDGMSKDLGNAQCPANPALAGCVKELVPDEMHIARRAGMVSP